jgi:predicted component of type VI protein secretion system
MEAIGGTVFRRSLAEVTNKIHEENVAAMKADLAQMKAEHAEAKADQKAKLQEKINQLDSKIQTQMRKIHRVSLELPLQLVGGTPYCLRVSSMVAER